MRSLIVGAALLAAAGSAGPEPFLMGYLGGSGTDDCDGIAVDGAGDLYLGCHSDSPDFPHPARQAHGKVYASGLTGSRGLPQRGWRVQAGFGGGPFDAFVIALDAARLPK